jgi:hypothetical protein
MLDDMDVSDIESYSDFGDDCIASVCSSVIGSECSSVAHSVAMDHLSWMDQDGEQKREEDEDEIEEEALAAEGVVGQSIHTRWHTLQQ